MRIYRRWICWADPPRCTTARDDRRIVRMAMMNRAAPSRTVCTTDLVCYTSYRVRSYHSTPFAAEWDV
ncbi:hypothetical protein TNCV_4948161 [Trichonephila clavipes]|nr:hypothetical protein TNCV_4948161 [Trichonephila clavipes]